MRVLDLFCGAGGATRGYQRAGFHVTGVDTAPQPHYCGDAFHQADALAFPLDGYDLIHASPPCQHYANVTHRGLLPFMHKGERAYADAMGCGWMTAVEAREAIPPAYTLFLAEQFLALERAA